MDFTPVSALSFGQVMLERHFKLMDFTPYYYFKRIVERLERHFKN